MKKFILTGVTFFAFGVIATIGVFFAINYFSLSTNFQEIKNDVGDSLSNPLVPVKDKLEAGSLDGAFTISEEGLP
jgi:hypothetical protein